jgi:hypothetical protein
MGGMTRRCKRKMKEKHLFDTLNKQHDITNNDTYNKQQMLII